MARDIRGGAYEAIQQATIGQGDDEGARIHQNKRAGTTRFVYSRGQSRFYLCPTAVPASISHSPSHNQATYSVVLQVNPR